MMDWQPIETAPKNGENVIVMYTHIGTQCVFNAFYAPPVEGWGEEDEGWGEEDEGWWTYTYSKVSRVKLDDWRTPTHWMPLPNAPKAQS